jgi:hypothetical protein
MNNNIINTIESMINEMNNNINILNINSENNLLEFDIQFEVLENNKKNNYFKSCSEINEKLDKPIKIKKDDKILLEQCFICIENYKSLEYKRILPNCNHCFHKKCIDKWIKKKASCPICRDEIIKTQ